MLNALTGPIAAIGEYLDWGAQQAAREINAAGGIKGKPVKVIGVDTALDPQKGSVEMAKLVEKTLVALGPVPEPVIMAAMPIAVENRHDVHHGHHLVRVRGAVLPLDSVLVPARPSSALACWSPGGPSSSRTSRRSSSSSSRSARGPGWLTRT